MLRLIPLATGLEGNRCMPGDITKVVSSSQKFHCGSAGEILTFAFVLAALSSYDDH